MKHSASKIVTANDTASSYNSGLVEVFATPALIALMENTCLECVQPFLPEGYGTVGFEVNIRHLKPTPVGRRVYCNAELTGVNNKKLVFTLVAHDEEGRIGEGSHTRYIIDQKKFMDSL